MSKDKNLINDLLQTVRYLNDGFGLYDFSLIINNQALNINIYFEDIDKEILIFQIFDDNYGQYFYDFREELEELSSNYNNKFKTIYEYMEHIVIKIIYDYHINKLDFDTINKKYKI